MKIFLILLTTVFFGQSVFAEYEDKNAAMPNSKISDGVVLAEGYTGTSQQKATCLKCEENEKAMLSNTVGVWKDSSGNVIQSGSSEKNSKVEQ